MPPASPKAEALIDAYLALSAEQGVHAVTLEMVAKRAKVAYSTAHYHFGNADRSILDAAIAHVSASAGDFIGRCVQPALLDPSVDAVVVYVEANFRWLAERREQASFWLYTCYLASVLQPYRGLVAQWMGAARQRIQGLLLQEIGKGHYRPMNDAALLATHIHNQVFGGLLAAGATAEKAAIERQAGETVAAIAALVARAQTAAEAAPRGGP